MTESQLHLCCVCLETVYGTGHIGGQDTRQKSKIEIYVLY